MILVSAATKKSHPAGVRGLKPAEECGGCALASSSHPAGVRGLKHNEEPETELQEIVAPRRGAWIETFVSIVPRFTVVRSHPAGVRGLKLRL